MNQDEISEKLVERYNDTSALNASPHWTAASERGRGAEALVKNGVLAL